MYEEEFFSKTSQKEEGEIIERSLSNNNSRSIAMARNSIGLMGIDMEDDGKDLPKPGTAIVTSNKDDSVTLVDVDFTEYRKRVDNRSVKKIVQSLTG